MSHCDVIVYLFMHFEKHAICYLYLYLLYDPWIDHEVEHAFVLLLLLFFNNLSVNLKAQCVRFGSIYLRESILPGNVNTSLFVIFSIFD